MRRPLESPTTQALLETQISADLPPIPADGARERVNGITHSIIGAAQKVSTKLGQGFLEKVYENALGLELRRTGLAVEHQRPVAVRYEGVIVGDYVPDLIVGNEVVVEVKTVDFLERAHRLQCINYLRATGLHVCLLLNFGTRRLEMRRLVMKF
jgi:GxxExxY protein